MRSRVPAPRSRASVDRTRRLQDTRCAQKTKHRHARAARSTARWQVHRARRGSPTSASGTRCGASSDDQCARPNRGEAILRARPRVGYRVRSAETSRRVVVSRVSQRESARRRTRSLPRPPCSDAMQRMLAELAQRIPARRVVCPSLLKGRQARRLRAAAPGAVATPAATRCRSWRASGRGDHSARGVAPPTPDCWLAQAGHRSRVASACRTCCRSPLRRAGPSVPRAPFST